LSSLWHGRLLIRRPNKPAHSNRVWPVPPPLHHTHADKQAERSNHVAATSTPPRRRRHRRLRILKAAAASVQPLVRGPQLRLRGDPLHGKYCGVGWSGCDGEEPCDDLDACCRDHDHCVDKKGLMSVKCHEKFKNCMRKVKKAGKVGFSAKCPYEMAMATMTQGMDMAIMLSQLGSQKLEL
ncbi:unnamed protein product, partial [Urochloa humidicola]